MVDPILEAFLDEQAQQGAQLARQSDLLELVPLAKDRYVARFLCKGLIRNRSGEVVEAEGWEVGMRFPSDYLRHVNPFEVLTWLHPIDAWHPNIRAPAICAGWIPPGTELVDLLYQCFEIITYVNWASHDPLNAEAAQWARNNQHRFPVDRRPLKRRQLHVEISDEVRKP